VSDNPLEWLAGQLLSPGSVSPVPYLSEAGTLTQAIVSGALDGLWNKRWPLPPGGYAGGREPFGAVPVVTRPPEWTVEADGYRLVIKDGAMTGLEWDGMVPGFCHRCRKPLGKVSWDAADYVFCKRHAKAEEVYTPPQEPH
jgi:hypothetical protein